MPIKEPARVSLARCSTPLEKLERTSQTLGIELYVKRDDLTGCELSGNKVRKLEYLLADAKAHGADTVITGGGEQSNHCRATALAATRLGLRSVLFLRTTDVEDPPATTGNILLDRLAGAEVVWIDHSDWQRRAELFSEHADRLRQEGRVPYVIPEGGSNAVGAWGYVRCARELGQQLAELPPMPTTIVHACGSGGTAAGLILGAAMEGFAARDIKVAAINVCDDRDYFVRAIGTICRDFCSSYGADFAVGESDIEVVDGHVGIGYAKSTDAELSTIRDVARSEALILDPVYSGKAFHGLCVELEKDRERFGARVVFVHTGGIFGLFPAAGQMAPLL